MGYNRDNYKKIKDEFAGKRTAAISAAELRTEELERKYPDLKKLNLAIRETGLRIFDSAFEPGVDIQKKVAEIEDEYNQNITFRNKFLEAYGYPTDYLDAKFECDKCKDEGFDNDGKMCICMKKALALATYKSSGIGKLIEKQSFDNFKLDYYEKGKERDNMEAVLDDCKSYTDSFTSKTSENLLFFGTTGLGKTHLSTSIAKGVIDRGFDVVYVTAQDLFEDFEREKFSRSYSSTQENTTEKYFECDLLIIDDLGTELSNQFTVSCLYNLINSRINSEKPMIINTNLNQNDLRDRYADRITSRLFGEFSVMCFYGKDIRLKKLDEN